MSRKPLSTSISILILAAILAAPCEVSANRPPRPVSAAVWETLGGVAGGVALGFAGGWIGASFTHCGEDRAYWGGCPDSYAGIFAGLLAGYSIGTPLGVWATGKALRQGGSGAAAAVGSFFGEVATATFLARVDMNADLKLPIILVVPAAVSTTAYHYFADPPEESETARRLRESAGKGAWAALPASSGVPARDRFRAELFTFRF